MLARILWVIVVGICSGWSCFGCMFVGTCGCDLFRTLEAVPVGSVGSLICSYRQPCNMILCG